jgi:hypothetical protein
MPKYNVISVQFCLYLLDGEPVSLLEYFLFSVKVIVKYIEEVIYQR